MSWFRAIMTSRGARALQLGLALTFLASCIPTTSTGALTCQTEGGDTVNVREIYGTWKLIRGYTDGSRTEEELEHNYDVLVVQTGGGLCRVGYESQSPMETVMKGVYSHDVTGKTLDISLSIPYDFDVSARYSFSGGCSDPTMTLSYTNGAVETYRFRGKDIGQGCEF
ncbi:MAG TPA: hypothetical protein VM901_08325 [Bdellovibrionota bacterium]|jgi:hypothetical protein|nr:hypothetical protein [Bdellovibrionota bacterium]